MIWGEGEGEAEAEAEAEGGGEAEGWARPAHHGHVVDEHDRGQPLHAQGARDDGLLVGVDLEHAHLVGGRERDGVRVRVRVRVRAGEG